MHAYLVSSVAAAAGRPTRYSRSSERGFADVMIASDFRAALAHALPPMIGDVPFNRQIEREIHRDPDKGRDD